MHVPESTCDQAEQIERMLLSVLPIVAHEAALSMEGLACVDQDDLRVARFAGLGGGIMIAPAADRVTIHDVEIASFRLEGVLEILYALSLSESCKGVENGMSVLVESGQAALGKITAFVEQGGGRR